MRLWTLHPQYLDQKGLTAAWREGLLAKKVLEGRTRGYTKHPQLERFRESPNPIDTINTYLFYLWTEACERGYAFDRNKFDRNKFTRNETRITAPREAPDEERGDTSEEPSHQAPKIEVTSSQVLYEYELLKYKLAIRDPVKLREIEGLKVLMVNPLFCVKDGNIERWEKVRPEIMETLLPVLAKRSFELPCGGDRILRVTN